MKKDKISLSSDTPSIAFPPVQYTWENDEISSKQFRFSKPIFRVGDTHVTSKNLLHWKNNNLLFESKKSEIGWSKFNFVEYIWLQIIVELRSFGLSIEKISKIKDELIFPLHLLKIAEENYTTKKFKSETGFEEMPEKYLKNLVDDFTFEYTIQTFKKILFNCINDRKNILIIVCKTGDAYFHEEGETVLFKHYFNDGNKVYSLTKKTEETVSEEGNLEKNHPKYNLSGLIPKNDTRFWSCITISITDLIRNYLLLNKFSIDVNEPHILSDNEMKVLELLKINDLTKLTIRVKNKNIVLIEYTQSYKNIDVAARYIDHLMKYGYQEVNYETKRGQIVCFFKTTRIKP